MAAKKVPVYISFDYDHDETLKVFLVGQADNDDSPFFIKDVSIKEATTNWKDEARARIKGAEQVAVICGKHTDTATGVNAEIEIAREEGTPYFLLSGYKDGVNKKPTTALNTDKMYRWDWANLKILINGGR